MHVLIHYRGLMTFWRLCNFEAKIEAFLMPLNWAQYFVMREILLVI